MSKIKVEGHSNLYRDPDSGAVINSSRADYERYMKAKTKQRGNGFGDKYFEART